MHSPVAAPSSTTDPCSDQPDRPLSTPKTAPQLSPRGPLLIASEPPCIPAPYRPPGFWSAFA